MLFFIYTVIWIRWTLPRFRFDQLMALGWKLMLPVSLSYVIIVAVALYMLGEVTTKTALILFGINLILLFLIFGVFDRGRVLLGSRHGRVRG
jgi:NADH-quinone oxidoreductase subunit H